MPPGRGPEVPLRLWAAREVRGWSLHASLPRAALTRYSVPVSLSLPLLPQVSMVSPGAQGLPKSGGTSWG